VVNRFGLVRRNRPYGLLWAHRTAPMLVRLVTIFALLLDLKQTGASSTQVRKVAAQWIVTARLANDRF
jgi:hypothetical protein